jgi:hypothetical protein
MYYLLLFQGNSGYGNVLQKKDQHFMIMSNFTGKRESFPVPDMP